MSQSDHYNAKPKKLWVAARMGLTTCEITLHESPLDAEEYAKKFEKNMSYEDNGIWHVEPLSVLFRPGFFMRIWLCILGFVHNVRHLTPPYCLCCGTQYISIPIRMK